MICWASWPLTMSRKKRGIIRYALQIICWRGRKNIELIITLQLKMSRNMILHHDLFGNKKAFTMSSLLDKLCSLLPEGLSTKYYTAKLQTRFQNHYGDTIVIESKKGQGQSNIVFSSSISVADAIRAASELRVFRGRNSFRRCPWYVGRSDSSWCCECITWLFTRSRNFQRFISFSIWSFSS